MANLTVTECAAKGAALLDQVHPEWAHKVYTETLDIYEVDDCVLAQVFGGYLEGLDAIGDFLGWHFTNLAQMQYGFDGNEGLGYTFTGLTEAWAAEADKRRF